MKCSYKLWMIAVFALLVSVAVSEESIEVSVDNTPRPSPKEIALMEEVEGLNAELKRVNENLKSKKELFEKEITEKMKEIEILKEQLQKKQAAFAELEMIVSSQNDKLKTLSATNSKLQAHIEKLNAPITFLDFVVDAFEHHILPGCEMLIEKVTPYVNMVIDYIKFGWAAVVEFWNTNEVCLKVRAVVVEYATKLAHIISTFWKETVMPKINEVLEPYYPTLTEYYQKAREAVVAAWNKTCDFICESSRVVFTQLVDKYELLHTELSKACGEYTPFLHYLILVSVLTCVMKLLCLCCPCKWCCRKKCC